MLEVANVKINLLHITVEPEILAGILFGGFAKIVAKLILAVFNLTVAE